MEKMPPKMALFAGGSFGELTAVDAKELRNYETIEHFQPLEGIGYLGDCDGGDPWK